MDEAIKKIKNRSMRSMNYVVELQFNECVFQFQQKKKAQLKQRFLQNKQWHK